MAAQPEETAGLNHTELEVKSMTATETKRKQGKDKLPCLSNYAPWKDCFYEKVQQRCLSLQETKVKMIHAQKVKEEKVKKREPCDWLSKEWFSEDKESLDTRIYLLDKLLPTLIPGVENLLMEVERKNVLAPDKEPTKFNPINFLGEYLMRHHPQYGISIKPGPYLRGMKMVLEQLKAEVPGTASERLARLKSEAKNKRKEREQVEIMKSQVKKMRKEALAVQFREWTVDVSGRIPVALVQSSLRSFLDVIASTPIDVRKVYDKKLEVVNTLEKKVNIDEFTEYVHFYTEHFSDDMFQEILKHFRQCADDFREAIRHDTRRRMFADLFLDHDYGKVGLLDRQKILALLLDFYDNSPVAAKRGFCNPRQWPIIELQEIELADLWGGIETERQTESASAGREEEDFPGSASPGYSLSRDGEPGSEKQVEEEDFSLDREPDTGTDREEDYHVLDREPGSEGQVSQEGDNLIAEAANTISGPAPEAVTMTTDDRAVADTDTIASEQDAPVAEVVRETPARKESFSRQHGSQFDQQTSSETRQQDEDLVQDQGPAHSGRQDSPAEASQEFEVPCSGGLLTSDLTFRYSSYGEKIPEDWKCDNTKFPDLCPIVAEIQNRGASCTRSAFDKSCLNLPQFVQLIEVFVGEDISLPAVKRFIAFIKEEYKQTEEEKMEQLKKIHRISRLAQRKLLLEALFEKWDNNASGFLDLEEVDAVLSTFKEGMEKEALRKAKQHLCSRYPQLSRVKKLSPKAFQTFLELVASEFTGDEDEAIDNLVEFLTINVERSGMEHLRSLTRRKWLHNIQQAAETSGASVEGVYKAVFKALSQDAEAHGDNKKISAYIALLEENQLSPERGQILLRYVACTADDAPYVLNKILYRDMKGVSFTAVEEGKPIHVPQVQLHGNIHFWNDERPVEERKGSFLVLPLHDARWRVFGILGVDTLQDQCEKTIFLTHEISFYQGVSHAFSKAYHHIHTLKNVLQMTVTALDWLCPRAPGIHTVTTYLAEPGKEKPHDYTLRKMITTDNTGQKEIHSSPELLLRKENLLRDYLFKCTDSSVVTRTSVCREHHVAVPLRDLSGRAFGLFDISIGHHQKLPPHEHKDLQKMLKVSQAACSEILKMSSEETEPTELEAEHVVNSRYAGILFYRFLLQDLRECIQKLDAESFVEIKSYVEPPALVHNIVKAVLVLLHPSWKGSEETENWSQCKLKLDDNLIQEIYCFDPTAASVQVQAELLLGCITGEHRAETGHQGWWPARLLGHWVHTCLALAQGTSSLHVANKRRLQAGDGWRQQGGFSPPSPGNRWPRGPCPTEALAAPRLLSVRLGSFRSGSAPFGFARLISVGLGSPEAPRAASNSLFPIGTFATRQWAVKKASSPTSLPLRPLSSSLTERDRGAAGAAGVGREGAEVGRLGREESAAAERGTALPGDGSGRDKMAALSKQYGLIMPKKLPQKNLVSKKLSVFADDSDEEPSVGESLQKEALKKQAMKQTKLEMQKALEEDATVYEYDSIYDEMQQKKKESNARVLSGKDDKKPRYIQNILKAAEIRKKEQEKRMERKIQKEREMEGEEFAHKEAFVTSAYKKKLQERAEEEERERREAALEAYLDVTKQKDLSGFYRHLLNQRVGEEETPKCSFREARIKEEKPDSYDENNQRNKCPCEGQKLEPSVKKENNPDADTDLGTDSSDDDKRHKSSKVNLKKKRRVSSVSSEEEAKLPKSQRHSRSPSSSSVEEEPRTKAQTNHLTKRGESRPSRRGNDEQYRERDYERSRTHEKDHQREKEDRHRYGDHSSKDNYRRREEQDDKQRGKERKEREGHGREWRKAKEREEKGSEKEREKERIRNGRDRYNDREKERGEKCREKEDHVKERREKYGSDEKRYRERRESSPTSLEKDRENNVEKERKGKEREVDEKGRSSSGILSEQKRKAGEEGEKEEKEQAQKPPESMSKFAKRSNEETVMSARDRYLARQMARVGTKSYIEKEED